MALVPLSLALFLPLFLPLFVSFSHSRCPFANLTFHVSLTSLGGYWVLVCVLCLHGRQALLWPKREPMGNECHTGQDG